MSTPPNNESTSAEEKYQLALDYHSQGRPGKIEIIATKPCLTARDLSLAYSPGVAAPCLEIAKNPDEVYKYTGKGNLVAVLSNGTAVLGLGDIGPLAGKPVMEGKGVLFKRFADIDVFDIEINNRTVEDIVRTVRSLEPTFGGINLEDIKAPECFEVERQLQDMNIPVFHDDQHGTAIIGGAAFINACEVTGRDVAKTKVVVSGAGAAAIATAKFFIELGVDKKNVIMCDSKGVIWEGRTDGMNEYKAFFASNTKARTLADAMKDADCFIGCSAKGLVSKDMVKSMAKDPIIFAMANPDPEITPEEVAEVRSDAIMATGRSDYPNQVNNVLGFPFIFRGALDVRATKINEQMKKAAAMALAALAKEEVPDDVKRAYGNENFSFGRNYLIPKPFDKRVLTRVSPAVAKAAMDSGVARIKIDDMNAYAKSLQERLGQTGSIMRNIRSRVAGADKPKIVFPEGTNARILKAVSILNDEGLIQPILLGNKKLIHKKMDALGVSNLKTIEILTTNEESPNYDKYVNEYFQLRQRKGVSLSFAKDTMKRGNYFGSMMVRSGHADGMITGATQNYPECIKPIMKVVGTHIPGKPKVAGIMILVFKTKVIFMADCTVQQNPDANDLADIAVSAAQLYRRIMQSEPRVAFLSYSNFGSNRDPQVTKMSEAVKIARAKDANLIADGEMQADVATNSEIMRTLFDFSNLDKAADLLIFPDLNSANISYKLLSQLGGATPIGPILLPLRHAINIVQRTSTVDEIVNMSHLTALISQEIKAHKQQIAKQ